MDLSTPRFARLTDIDAIRRAAPIAGTTAALSLAGGLAASLSSPHWTHVLLSAVTGQLSTTMIKLFCFGTFIVLGIAFLSRAWKPIPPMVGIASLMAGLAFDLLAAASGIFIGILLPAFIQSWRLGCMVFPALAVSATGQACMVILARLLANPDYARFFEKRRRPALMGLFLAGMAIWALNAETWSEIPAAGPAQHAQPCTPIAAGS
ncbi:hypothetical protein [Luteibacter aegosomatissinici]|uniref:hypothetical protein n=1 Tax=Luteibacter aegosomatissinici TaxID=2911539 RepID=UPI001FF7B3D4|nr:hypothetical protein [Luteibacter aegosomatissinici]UPG92695.1 hypothetical protein L2Y97_12545 [Luteibacter aegosomatissinici]